MGTVTGFEHHFAGAYRSMALESSPPAHGVDPGVADTPEQQQRACQLDKQLIEGLAAGDIKHGAKNTEGTRIQRWPTDRLHQGFIDVGLVDIHLVEGAANRGRPAQIFKQQPLQHRTFEQGSRNGLAGDRSPALRRRLLIAEGPCRIQQHHPGRLVP